MEKAIQRILLVGFIFASSFVFSQTDYSYSAQLYYHTNYPMNGATVTIQSTDGNYIATTTTNNTGTYLFTGVPAGTYYLSFENEESSGGVDLCDAFLVMLKIFNIVQLNEIQTLAADVNGSGNINWTDYNLIVTSYLNQGNPFPIGDWVFETETITIPGDGQRTGDLKLGSSSGDVNGSLVPDPKGTTLFIENLLVHLEQENREPLNFELKCQENLQISGMHLAFQIPSGLRIDGVDSPIENITYSINNGILKVTWLDNSMENIELASGTALLSIHTEEISPSRNAVNYHIALLDESHVVDKEGNLVSGLKLTLPEIVVDRKENVNTKAFPNPFLSNVTIEYLVREPGIVNISIFDQYGRQITVINEGEKDTGVHQVIINGASFQQGVYHYRINCDNNVVQNDQGIIIKSK